MINMYLETAYKGESGRTEVEFKDNKGEEYVIVLKDMREYLKKDRKNKVDVIRREKVIGMNTLDLIETKNKPDVFSV